MSGNRRFLLRVVGALLFVSLAAPALAQGLFASARTVRRQDIITDAGQPFSAIDTSWAKPVRRASTIRVKNGQEACGQRGDGGDVETNRRKNRTDTPADSYLVTVDAIRALPDTALWRHKGSKANRESWEAKDRVKVYPYEGTPVTVVGYFEIVKPQRGNTESTNCHASAEVDTDWHIALVASPNETEEQSVVIEPTPRYKRRNTGWVPATAQSIAVRRQPSSARDESVPRVRVTGYLMLDPSHPNHIRGECTSSCGGKRFFRATLWEIHPVTRIEVWRNNVWVDLNDY